MMKKTRLNIATAILFPLLAVGAPAEPGITADSIVIGQVAGFTGPGAGEAAELTSGAKAYFDSVNAAGGIHGRKIVLQSMDDGSDPLRTPAVVKKLIEETNVFAMFLSQGAKTTEAAYTVLEQAGVPLVGPSTGAKGASAPPRKFLFPVRASYQTELSKIVPQLVNMGIDKIAILHDDDAFGAEGLTSANLALKAVGKAPAIVASQPQGGTDVAAAVGAIAKVEPQAIIVISGGDTAIAFIKAMKAAGRSPAFLTLSNNASSAFISGLGEDGWGVTVSQVTPYPFSKTPAAGQLSQDYAAAVASASASYRSMEGFMAAKVLVEGLKRATATPTREKLIAGLESMQGYDLGGATVSYGPQNRSGSDFVELTIISKRGKFFR